MKLQIIKYLGYTVELREISSTEMYTGMMSLEGGLHYFREF